MEEFAAFVADPATHRDLLSMIVRDAPAVYVLIRYGRRILSELGTLRATVGQNTDRIARLEAASAVPLHSVADRESTPIVG